MTVRIELIHPKHESAVQAFAGDPGISATTTLPHPYPEDGAMKWIQKSLAGREKGHLFEYAVLDDQELVGVCGLLNISQGSGEVGYWTGRPHWGRGFASQSVFLLLEQAFGPLNLHRVYAHCLLTNRASSRVLEKTGFHLTEVKNLPDSKWPTEPVAVFEQQREMWHTGQGR